MAAKKKYVVLISRGTGKFSGKTEVYGYSDSYVRACVKMGERIRWDSLAVVETDTGKFVAGNANYLPNREISNA